MGDKYHFKKSYPKRKKRITKVVITTVMIMLLLAGLVGLDLYRHRFKPQNGTAQTIVQAGDTKTVKTINEPDYSFDVPTDWHEISRVNANIEHSVTWQAGKKDEENRYLKIYIDTIPKLAVNKMLPIHLDGSSIKYDDLSENCASFTPGGSFDPNVALHAKDTPAQWENLDFICDLPKPFDNVIGTSSKDGVNTINITGPTKGAHKYFFVYTDRNIRPNYSIFYDMLTSFKAK